MTKKSNPLTRTQYIRSELGTPQSLAEFAEAIVQKFGGTLDEALDDIRQILTDDAALESEMGPDFLRRQLIAGTRKFYSDAVALGQMGPAGNALRALERLQGLDQPQQLQIEVAGSIDHNMISVRSRIAELLKKQSIKDRIREAGLVDEVKHLALNAGVNVEDGEPIAKPTRRHFLGDRQSVEPPRPALTAPAWPVPEPTPARKVSPEVAALASALAARSEPEPTGDEPPEPVPVPALPPTPANRPPPEPRPHPLADALKNSRRFGD